MSTANTLSSCVSSLRSSMQLLDSSISILDSGTSDFPRLARVLQVTRVAILQSSHKSTTDIFLAFRTCLRARTTKRSICFAFRNPARSRIHARSSCCLPRQTPASRRVSDRKVRTTGGTFVFASSSATIPLKKHWRLFIVTRGRQSYGRTQAAAAEAKEGPFELCCWQT